MRLYWVLISMTFVLNLPAKTLFSQQKNSYTEEINVYHGLPNNFITCMHKDSRGYIWIGTLYGLAKYDGNKFTNFMHYSDINSISGYVISTVFEDRKGNMLFGSNGLSIYFRKTHKWINYLPDAGNPFPISSIGISSIAQENDSIYWITTYCGINKFNINTGRFVKINYPIIAWQNTSRILHVGSDNSILFKLDTLFLKYNIKSDSFKKVPARKIYGKNELFFFQNNIIGKKNSLVSHRIELVRYDIQTSKEYTIALLENDNSISFHNNENLFIVNNDSIKVYNQEFKYVKSIYFRNQQKYNHSQIKFTCGLIERNGTIWLGSEIGLFKIIPQTPFYIIDCNSGLPNEYIRSLKIDSKNDLLVGVKNGSICKIPDVNNFLVRSPKGIKTIDPLSLITNQILELKNGNLLCVTNNSLAHYSIAQNKFTDLFSYNYNPQYFSALEISNGLLIGSLTEPCLIKVDIEQGKIKYDTSFKIKGIPSIVNTIYKDKTNQIWLGGEGLFRANFQPNSKGIDIEPCISGIEANKQNINLVWNIMEVDSSRLIVCTTTNGFNVYNKNTKEYKHFGKRNGLSTDFTCAILKDHHNNFWMSTKEGISFIDGSNFSIKNYVVKNGSFNYEFNFKCCAKTSNNWLLFGSKQGIVCFHPDSLIADSSKYTLRINEFRIFDEKAFFELSNKDTISLTHYQNFFSFEFSLQDYRNPTTLQYRYQLLNYDKFERITDGRNPIASYTDVPPGKYTFTLIGYSTEEPANQQKVEILVIIQPAFYQTILFLILIVVIVCFITGAIIYLYVKRQSMRGRLNKIELDLLRSQMNPHFIFNTLTSIQHSVLKKSKTFTLEFISKFSQLMRMCLDYSTIEYITLEKALQFYSTYISIESANLDEEIDFRIIVSRDIDIQKLEVSPMLIQPFIENAIVHGLSPRNKDMKLLLEISRMDTYLLCVIEDNGIGRARAAEIAKEKAKRHNSVGIELTKKGIILQLQQIGLISDQVEIIDNYDDYGNALGTTVRLKIAFQISKIS